MHADSDRAEILVQAPKLLRMILMDRRAGWARIRRGVGIVRAHVLFRGAEIGARVNATGYVRVVADGSISLAPHVQFLGGMIPSQIVCRPGGELVVGAHTSFNYGVVIECTTSIRFGERCLVGSMTCFRDSDMRRSGPIVIEDGVWVAHGAIVEPGVRIGAGSIVSAGSVVTTDVPPDSLALGNPAESFPLGSDVKEPPARLQGGRVMPVWTRPSTTVNRPPSRVPDASPPSSVRSSATNVPSPSLTSTIAASWKSK
jgi:acetyltransferase-like isoleucine patch superfamily enzyme